MSENREYISETETEKPRIIVVSAMHLMRKLVGLGYLDDFCGVKPNKYDPSQSAFLFNYSEEINDIVEAYRLERRAQREIRHEKYGD